MKNKSNGCWMHRMHAITIIVIIYLLTSALNSSLNQNSRRTSFTFEQTKKNERSQSICCLEQQKNGETGNRNTLIPPSFMSGPQTPNAPNTNSTNNGYRYDPPLLETQTQSPIAIEYCVTGYEPASNFDAMDSVTTTSAKSQSSIYILGILPRDSLYGHSEIICNVGETHIKEASSIFYYQQEYLSLRLYKISELNFFCATI